MKKVGLIGFGVVGRGAFEILNKRKAEIKNYFNEDVEVVKILVRNKDKAKDYSHLLANDFEDFISTDLDVVAEMTGDVEASYTYIKTLLMKKIPVVSSNKAVVSKYFEEFTRIANESNVAFLYESAVAAAIPCIEVLRRGVMSNEVSEVRGILNGTSNFILSKMFEEGKDYDAVLQTAKDLGYAESDPTDDVEGFDAMRKLNILSSIAAQKYVGEENIAVRGISEISKTDVDCIKAMGGTVKFIAGGNFKDNTFVVEPTIVKASSNFYNTNDAINLVEIDFNNAGTISLGGGGAGSLPTGDAVVRDILDALSGNWYPVKLSGKIEGNNLFKKSRYYVRTEKNLREMKSIVEKVIAEGEEKIFITKAINRQELIKKADPKDFFAKIL